MISTYDKRILNFSAGPAVLPEPVIKKLQLDLWNIDNSGIGIMEHSHRGPIFINILETAKKRVREVGMIPDDFEIVFLQGGASLQFSMIPMNFISQGSKAEYINTGVWTSKAIEAAKFHGNIDIIFNGNNLHFKSIPDKGDFSTNPKNSYLYYCSNNTIYGTRWHWLPVHESGVVCDMSSDFFSRRINWDFYDLVFAGAQKNLGPSGVVLVIIKKQFLKKSNKSLPPMLNYNLHIEKNSCYNTPPTFGIHALSEVCNWINHQGGLDSIEAQNNEKAKVIYDAIDNSNGFFSPYADKKCRSIMNIVFNTPSDELDNKFISEATELGMNGLKGHRNIGGIRASIYNAFPKYGCERLADFMTKFKNKY